MIKDNRGFATIKVLVLGTALFILLAFIMDGAYMFATKIAARHGLTLALREAVHHLEPDALTDPIHPRTVIIPDQAEAHFYEYLKKNLRLDGGLNPIDGSVADGKVSVEYFRVVNEGELPFNFNYGSYNETITQPSAVGIIKVPVKLSVFGRMAVQSEMVDLYVHATVAPEAVSKHFEEWR